MVLNFVLEVLKKSGKSLEFYFTSTVLTLYSSSVLKFICLNFLDLKYVKYMYNCAHVKSLFFLLVRLRLLTFNNHVETDSACHN